MLGILIGVAARRVLAAEFGSAEAARIWRHTRARHAMLRRAPMPARDAAAPGPGVALLLRVMAWDHALYAVLREQGTPETTAAGIIERVNWAITAPGLGLAWRVAGLAGGGVVRRVRRVVDALFATLFGAPFVRVVHPEPQAVAFTVTRCPLAEELAARGVPELTRAAACALDLRMAAAWGVRLERTGTLADGAAACDFRFVPLTRTGASTTDAVRTHTT